jgi:hypothetical protein
VVDRKPLEEVFHFDDEGTLSPPGPLGRLVRLLLGILILKFIIDWLTIIDSSDFLNPFILLWIAFSIKLAPYVINIGFGINKGAKPRFILLGIWVLGGLAGYLSEGVWRSEALWAVIEITQIYIYGHLGLSFFLSAILSTPGCEMRAIPHLLGKISGQGSQEHYCPGFLDNIDRWERSRGESEHADE